MSIHCVMVNMDKRDPNLLGKDFFTVDEAAHYTGIPDDQFKEKAEKAGLLSFTFMGNDLYRRKDVAVKLLGEEEIDQVQIAMIDRDNMRAAAGLYKNAKRNAFKRGIPFNITQRDVEALFDQSDGKCTITGISFTFTDCMDGERRPWFPSIDRIISSIGYEKENIRLVCVAVNIAMNTWGLPVLLKISDALHKKHGMAN